MNGVLARIAGSSLTHVAFAFFAMGSWGVFANRAHPMPEPVVAGVVQGALSSCITLLMKRSLERLSATLNGVAALWVPPVVVCSASLSILVLIHRIAGTPELFGTIILPFAVASTYAVVYSITLYCRKSNHG